jgi:hypothetical protein
MLKNKLLIIKQFTNVAQAQSWLNKYIPYNSAKIKVIIINDETTTLEFKKVILNDFFSFNFFIELESAYNTFFELYQSENLNFKICLEISLIKDQSMN